MPLDLALDLAHALDPVAFVQDRLKFDPDPWQARLLRSRARSPSQCGGLMGVAMGAGSCSSCSAAKRV